MEVLLRGPNEDDDAEAAEAPSSFTSKVLSLVFWTTASEATAALEPDAGSGEIAFRIDLGEASGVASLRLVTMAGGRPPVVVTDLPERLGLRGGTYVVERVEA